jgi:hypothetical protein
MLLPSHIRGSLHRSMPPGNAAAQIGHRAGGRAMKTKVCSHCNRRKPLAEFPKVGAVCKACKKAYHAQWRDQAFARTCQTCGKTKLRSEMQEQQPVDICKNCYRARKTKQCRQCGQHKALTDEFWHRADDNADGFRNQCKVCKNAQRADRYEEQSRDSGISQPKRHTRQRGGTTPTANMRWSRAKFITHSPK